jgi:hypothetical protein
MMIVPFNPKNTLTLQLLKIMGLLIAIIYLNTVLIFQLNGFIIDECCVI